MFLSPTCYGSWLFVGFCMGNSNKSAALIKQINHFKSLFKVCFIRPIILCIISILRLLCVGLMSFLLVINLDVVSFSNVFNSLISIFKCKGITIVNQWNFNLHCQK